MPFLNIEEIQERELIPGYNVRFVHTEKMTVAFWRVDKGAVLPNHSHPNEQVSQVVEGQFELTVDGDKRILLPGDLAVIPPDLVHSGKAITQCKLMDIFCPVREDYL